ncbi:MAG: DUF4922 domain-containing protein [Bacteroidales bacterium]|nr:DUF4922 domain-containing protein [Bacteroidales bacterium]
MEEQIVKFISDQLSVWPEVAARFRALKQVRTRSLSVNGLKTTLQFNPDRIRSSVAEVEHIQRPCFLCADKQPAEQHRIPFEGRKEKKYYITINPYPIFPEHLVISRCEHVPQSIWNNFVDMTDLAHHFPDYTFFYNGPHCGASAPDHLHFQAMPRGGTPLEMQADALLDRLGSRDAGVPNGEEGVAVPASLSGDIEYVCSVQEAQLYHYKHFTRGVFFLRSRTSKSLAKLFYRLLDCAPWKEGEEEPRFNLLAWYKPCGKTRRPEGHTHGLAEYEYRAIVLLRGEHRPHHYFSEGADHLTLSPGCADMCGLYVMPVQEEFERVDAATLEAVMAEVSLSAGDEARVLNRLTRTQPTLQVGIMSGEEISFEMISDGAGKQTVRYRDGKIDYNGVLYDELTFDAVTPSKMFAEPSFILYGVTIGVDFHWQRRQDQTFAGVLKFIVEDGKVVAVNVIGVEDYLLSVISSEMKASASLEYLKAHSVISRSWVMAQIAHKPQAAAAAPAPAPDGEEYIRWFDHDDHKHFDVCADDHCQRYQGLSIVIGRTVREAIDQTWGEVMMSEGEIVDARFSKCCGGVMEKFSTCWEDKDYPYLVARRDGESQEFPDLTKEKEAEKWIEGNPDAFCNTHDKTILSQVLKDYDLETEHFFRWEERTSIDDLSERIARRSGIDFGRLKALEPLERGVSGRLKRLRVVGEKRTMTIGKELIIRRWLSESHLYSSAFTVTFTPDEVILRGAGWGHGVGLCQIGAAVMSAKGYDYRQILQHYYPGHELKTQ